MKTAVILAAGKGTKIWPYNEYWPKAALPVGGVANVERLTRELKKLDFKRIIVVTNYLERRVRYVIGDQEEVEIICIKSPDGTADSVEKVIDQITEERILIVYGDVAVTSRVLKEMVTRYRTSSLDGLLLAKPMGRDRSQDWFCVKTSPEGKAKQIYGHPRPHYVDHRLLGIYALRTADLCDSLIRNPGFMQNVNVGAMPPMEAQLEQSLQLLIEQGKHISIHAIEDGVVDIDKPWHLMEANKMMIEQEVKTLEDNRISSSATIHSSAEISGSVVLGDHVKIGRNVCIKGNLIVGDGTVIDNGAIIEPNVMIGSNCSIEDYCKISAFSVIGHRNRIGHCAELQGVTFDNVSFTHFGEVYGVVGSSTDIAAGVTVGILRFDDLKQPHKINGRTEIPDQFGNAVFIGDYTRTGINNQYMPGVKIGSNCAIGPSVIVQEDISSNTLVYAEQTLIKKEWGPFRYGW